MNFDLQIAHSVEEIGQEAWDRLSKGRPFASYRWYRFGETVLADNTPIYIVLSRRGEPVARGTFWLRKREQLPISSKAARRLTEALLRRWPLLICQSPLVEASGLILPDPPLRDAALETIAHVAQEQARQRQAFFLSYVYLKKQQATYTGWPDALTAIEMPDPRTNLVITWRDFESYARQVSRSVRRNCKRATDMGIEITPHPMTQPLDKTLLDKIMALIRNVERRHNSAPDPWARAMLTHAHMIDAAWLKAELEGKLVCCCMLLRDGNTLAMKLLGRDYNVQYVYFYLFYSGIRYAIERGIQTLWGGSGAYETKRKLQFQIQARHYTIFAGRGPLLHRLGRWVAALEEQKNAAT